MEISEILAQLSSDFFEGNNPEDIQTQLDSKYLDLDQFEKKDLSKKPASIELIELAERRLNLQLPPSYRSFLLYSNGFSHISPFMDHILPIEKVDWTYDVDKEFVASLQGDDWEQEITDEAYLIYGENQDVMCYRPKYFKKCLTISNWNEGMTIMLNPEIVYNGEWEVIVFANWLLGCHRYPSFYNFLIETHKMNQRLIKNRKDSGV